MPFGVVLLGTSACSEQLIDAQEFVLTELVEGERNYDCMLYTYQNRETCQVNDNIEEKVDLLTSSTIHDCEHQNNQDANSFSCQYCREYEQKCNLDCIKFDTKPEMPVSMNEDIELDFTFSFLLRAYAVLPLSDAVGLLSGEDATGLKVWSGSVELLEWAAQNNGHTLLDFLHFQVHSSSAGISEMKESKKDRTQVAIMSEQQQKLDQHILIVELGAGCGIASIGLAYLLNAALKRYHNSYGNYYHQDDETNTDQFNGKITFISTDGNNECVTLARQNIDMNNKLERKQYNKINISNNINGEVYINLKAERLQWKEANDDEMQETALSVATRSDENEQVREVQCKSWFDDHYNNSYEWWYKLLQREFDVCNTHETPRECQLIVIAADVIYEESVIPLLIDTIYTSFRCFTTSIIEQQHNYKNEEDLHHTNKSFQSLLFYTPRALTIKQNVKIFNTLISELDKIQEWNKKLFVWEEQCDNTNEVLDFDNIEELAMKDILIRISEHDNSYTLRKSNSLA